MRALSAAAALRGSRKARRIHKALAVHGRRCRTGRAGGCLAGLRGVRFFGRRPGRKCIICKPQKTEKGE